MDVPRFEKDGGTVEGIARTARWVEATLGVWLFVSAFLWDHTREHFVSSAVSGLAITAVALVALFQRSSLHVLNVLISIWLFAALWILPGRSVATVINDMFVSVLVFGFACAGDKWHEELPRRELST